MAQPELLTSAIGPLTVNTAVIVGERVRYRRELLLSLPMPAGVDGIALNPEGLELLGEFRALDFDARAGGVDLAAHVSETAPGVAVELDGRWTVHQVAVTAAVTGALQLRRIDGETVAAEATTSAAISSQLATFETSGNAEFIDVRFAIVADAIELSPSHIQRIGVRSHPTGARLGLAAEGELDATELFWQTPGESRETVAFDAGEPFAQALQRHVAARFANGHPGDPLRVVLVIESDQPCVVELTAGGAAGTALPIDYAPTVRAFSDGPDKRVLRFSEQHGFRKGLSLSIPAGASVASATLRVLPSFRQVVTQPELAIALSEPPNAQSGMYLGTERWIGSALPSDDGALTSALAVALRTLAPDTELRWEIHTDASGQPSGHVLQSGSVKAPRLGAARWLSWPLQSAQRVAGAWLVLVAARGAAVWLGQPDGRSALSLARKPAPGPFTLEATLPDRGLLVRSFGVAGNATGDAAAPLALSVGATHATTLAASELEDAQGPARALELDITAGVNAYLVQHAASAQGNAVQVPLEFAVALPGILTVYPPEIELT